MRHGIGRAYRLEGRKHAIPSHCRHRGKGYEKLLDSMAAGGFNKVIDDPRTEADWISANEENVDRYLADENPGFMFPAGGYATLTALTREACDPKTFRAIPQSLPLLFIRRDRRSRRLDGRKASGKSPQWHAKPV